MAMTTVPTERCEVCNAEADARMRGMTLCARCALERVTAHRNGSASWDAAPQRRGRRVAFLGLFTSGFLAKMLLGGAALAAAGAVVATVAAPDPAPSSPDPTTTTDAVVTATTSTVVTDLLPDDPTTTLPATLPETAAAQAASAHDLVTAVQAWADCVAAAASAQGEGPLDFKVSCGPAPSPADYGLGTANPAPGQDKEPGREEAPGQVEPPGQAKQPEGDGSTADDDAGGKPAKEHRDSDPDDDLDDPADEDED
jgi:hypothetical protein